MMILLGILWYVIGSTGFIYWWTNEFDLKSSEIPLLLITGFLGPLSFIIGYLLHGEKCSKVIMRKRK